MSRSNLRATLHKTGKHVCSNSYGKREAYMFYIKHRPKDSRFVLEEGKFCKIITCINEIVREHIAMGERFEIPQDMGFIELKKFITGPRIVDGKLRLTMPIDWNSTYELWENDKEAFDERILIRFPAGNLYRVSYSKRGATFRNKGDIIFRPNRTLRQLVCRNVKERGVDAPFISREYGENYYNKKHR